jgi:hypothetical protein
LKYNNGNNCNSQKESQYNGQKILKKYKGQALDDKILHSKSNIEQHEAQGNLGVDSDNNLAVYRKCQIKYEQTKLHITIENKRQSQKELQLYA